MIEITSEALNSIRLRCEARMPFQSSEVLSLIAEVERLRAERQWQPMETAPRDGALILLWNGYGTLIGYWGCRSQCWLGSAPLDNPKLKEVTHWMPLPKPLSISAEGVS